MATVKININGTLIEVDKEQVSKAIETGEVKLESDKLIAKNDDTVVYTKDEFETFKSNFANTEYKKGRVDSAEMLIKAAKNHGNLDFEGKIVKTEAGDNVDFEKTAEQFWSKANPLIEDRLKLEPNEQIKTLKSDLEAVRTNYGNLESEFNTYKSNISEKETRSKKDGLLKSYLPNEGLKIDSDITLMALKTKAGIDIDYDEQGKEFITVNGQMVKDEKLHQPVEPKSFIEQKLTALDLVKKPGGGTGEGDNLGAAKEGSYDDFVKRMKAQNIEEGSQEFAEKLNAELSAGTVKM